MHKRRYPYGDIVAMKRISFTRHAKNRKRWHKISEQEIVLAIEKPEHIESSERGASNVWIETRGKYLRVTYRDETDTLLIVTAVKKKKGWR